MNKTNVKLLFEVRDDLQSIVVRGSQTSISAGFIMLLKKAAEEMDTDPIDFLAYLIRCMED